MKKLKKLLKNSKGFTLLEMLVVVLIIGILAGIALPQYKKAVIKSKLTQLDVLVNTGKKNVQLYLDANGWPTEDIFFTGTKGLQEIEMTCDHSTNYECYTTTGGYFQVDCAAGKGYCTIAWSEQSFYFRLLRNFETDFWYVEGIESNNNYAKVLCQWTKERNYPASGDVASLCDGFNISLESID